MSDFPENQDNLVSNEVVAEVAPEVTPEPIVVPEPQPEPVVIPEPQPEPVVVPEPTPAPVASPVDSGSRVLYSKKEIRGTEVKRGYTKVSESRAKELMSKYTFLRFANEYELSLYGPF